MINFINERPPLSDASIPPRFPLEHLILSKQFIGVVGFIEYFPFAAYLQHELHCSLVQVEESIRFIILFEDDLIVGVFSLSKMKEKSDGVGVVENVEDFIKID